MTMTDDGQESSSCYFFFLEMLPAVASNDVNHRSMSFLVVAEILVQNTLYQNRGLLIFVSRFVTEVLCQ